MKFWASGDLLHRPRWVGFAVLASALMELTAGAQTNSWIQPTSGYWQKATSWSLGIFPDSSQFVIITNAGSKTVTINATTAQNYSGSMTINRLTIDGENMLRLDNFGTNIALRVANTNSTEMLISTSGTLVNLNSSLLLDNVYLTIRGGKLFQDGGIVSANSSSVSAGGEYHLTNGIFETRNGGLALFGSGKFNQYNGNAFMSGIQLHGSRYNLIGGNVNIVDLGVSGSTNALGEFIQNGGTNRVGYSVSVGSSLSDNAGNYVLNGGMLYSTHIRLIARGQFTQRGGVNSVTDTLWVFGDFIDRPRGTHVAGSGSYSLVNGALSVRNIFLYGGNATFSQENGVTDAYSLSLASLDGQSKVYLSGGILKCSDVSYNAWYRGSGADILQTGGAFVVSNLLSFGGFHNNTGFAKYFFSGGTLTASNIDLAAEWIIGNSTQAGRITNSGYFKMAGTLRVGNANEKLGRFILSSNALVSLGDGAAKLSFAPSREEGWTNGAMLLVTNWNGATNGGGADQLIFGANNGGLTSGQLSQIRFVNPAGFAHGMYEGSILETGEVVPATPPSITPVQQSTKLILNWPANWALQISTNVTGPYLDISNAISPYEHGMTTNSRAFFRLRR